MSETSMRWAVIALGLLVAAPAVGAPFDHELSPLTVDVGPLLIGTVASIDITGAQSWERAYVLQSTDGEGAGACPSAFGGQCLGIVDATVLATWWTEIDGTLIGPYTVPATDGVELCLQVAVQRGNGGVHTELSNVVCRTIEADSDGDGIGDAADLCPGFDDARDRDGDGTPDDCDPFPECDGEDLGCGCNLPGPESFYADNDGDGVGAGPPITMCAADAADTCASMPYVELTSGDVEIPTDCAPGDYDCQAQAVCEAVTGVDCLHQGYDCATSTSGSYYPEGTPGGSILNFAIAYDFEPIGNIVEEGGTYGGHGNICCGDVSFCDRYDLRRDHDGAGYGHWGLDADAVGAITGAACTGLARFVDIDGDPCPTDPDDVDIDGDGVCDVEDVCLDGDDAVDTDADGIPDACDACPLVVGEGCVPDCSSLPYLELVSGDVSVPTDCAAGDYDCQAEAVCEFLTGLDCLYQTYDCWSGSGGSYYPTGTPGGSSFNFAIGYDFAPIGNIVEEGGTYGGYGNVCCADESFCDDYGLRKDHDGSGFGHWGLDADGVGCLP